MNEESNDLSIVLNGVGKRYAIDQPSQRRLGDDSYFWALKDVTFSVPCGTILGIVGRNGAGKTTLLSMMAGIIEPSVGSLTVNGRIASVLNLGVGFQDELTGRENIYLNASLLGMSNSDIDKRFDSILQFSELNDFIDVSLGKYSQGMRLRLGFSVAAHLDFDIMFIDEVLMVGDGAFQKKCLEQLVKFKRMGKVLVVTTQDHEVIERISDMVLLLEEGRACYVGEPQAAIEKYKQILVEHKGLHLQEEKELLTQTKWWLDPGEDWGTREGSREVIIDRVMITNRWGRPAKKIKPHDRLSVTLHFTVNEPIYNPHVGVALFREDGVYCFGPNTRYDGLPIDCLQRGSGSVTLTYRSFPLMPGTYRLSVVIWDEKEKLAHDYLKGYFTLEVEGSNPSGELVAIAPRVVKEKKRGWLMKGKKRTVPKAAFEPFEFEEKNDDRFTVSRVSFLDKTGTSATEFNLGDYMGIEVEYAVDSGSINSEAQLWVGIFRSDAICCSTKLVDIVLDSGASTLFYDELPYLPGEYSVWVGLWDQGKKEFISMSQGEYRFQMLSSCKTHGTLYIDHEWHMQLPNGRRS